MLVRNRLFGVLAVLITIPPAAAKDVLLFLEHMNAGKPVSWEVVDKPGRVAVPGKSRSEISWHVRQGTPVIGAAAPRSRRVDFYQGEGVQRQIMCALEVKYFRIKNKWLPHYRLYQEVLFVRDGDRWRPLDNVAGVPVLVEHSSAFLANAEGFYPALDFGLTVGKLEIDAWQVMEPTASPSLPPP